MRLDEAFEHSRIAERPSLAPLMTREAFAEAVGLPVGVLIAQASRGFWPQISVGKRVFINVEAVRAKALEHGQQFSF